MVLSRIRNYRLLLQRQLHTKSKITSKILAWETQTAITAGRVRTTFCIFDLPLSRTLSVTLFSLSFSLSLSFFLLLSDSNSTRKLQRHVWTCIYNARLHTYTLRHLRMRTRRMIISLTVERWKYLKLITHFLKRLCFSNSITRQKLREKLDSYCLYNCWETKYLKVQWNIRLWKIKIF